MLRPWPLIIVLDRSAARSVGQQIVHAVIEEIRRGRIQPGTPLPGSRDFAKQLGVNRKTIVEAYGELQAQGWLSSQGRRGTFVADDLPVLEDGAGRSLVRRAAPIEPLFAVDKAPPDIDIDLPSRDMLVFDDGAPDIRFVPVEILARAYRNGLRSTLQRRRLGYGDPRGSEQLREVLVAMLNAERGISTSMATLCLARGSQMAISVVAQAIICPGDTVVIETLSYPPAREAFRRAGGQIETVGVDQDGIQVDELERVCRRGRVRAVYVTPHHHFPTTVSMTAQRRMRLMGLAAQFGFAIIEDDYDHEFHFAHQPMLPLAAFDSGGQVVYIGSLSKLLSPSLRLGYISAPPALIESVAREIVITDRQGDPAMEAAIAEFIEAGELHRHTRKMKRLYAVRREHFTQCLLGAFEDRVAVSASDGGLAFWVQFAGVDVDQLLISSRKRRLHFLSPRAFSATREPVDALRLGFASLDLDELEIGTRRLRDALGDIGE